MTQILGQLSGMVESAIVNQRELVICTQHGNNRTMTSFVPSEFELDDCIYITGDNYSLNLEMKESTIFYDSLEEEFQLLCGNVIYYIGLA